jgi:hypothetical protein
MLINVQMNLHRTKSTPKMINQKAKPVFEAPHERMSQMKMTQIQLKLSVSGWKMQSVLSGH